MIKRSDIRGIYARTREMLFHPETEWRAVKRENMNGTDVFRGYLIPLAVAGSGCRVLLQRLLCFRHSCHYLGRLRWRCLRHVSGKPRVSHGQNHGSQRGSHSSFSLLFGYLHRFSLPLARNARRFSRTADRLA